MSEPVRDREIDDCGAQGCDRPAGDLLCERCARNLRALADALEQEGLQLSTQEQR